MKKLLFAALVLFTVAANAQTVDLRRKIEVTGTAEAEVTPDIIYFGISLKEYMDGRTRVDINNLESQLQKAITAAGVPQTDFTINNINGYTTYQKKKDPNFLAGKQYRIKLHDLNKVNQILASIDPKGLEYTNIESYEYSKIDDLKKELKLKALIAAKDKAAFLLSGIGEKLGGAIEVTEVEDMGSQPMLRNFMMKSAQANDSNAQPDIDFKKIKLNFQIKATFEIVK
jgi:uncharacterized protein YggE